MIRRLTHSLLLAGSLLFLLAAPSDATAQTPGGGGGGGRGGRANRDPAQFLARRMEQYRQQLGVTSDDEWKVIQPRIEKVMQAQRETRLVGFRGMRRGGNNPGGQTGSGPGATGRGNRGGRGNTPPSLEVQALQQALDSSASAEEVKARLAKVRETVKQREASLVKAQADLRAVLTTRQEAVAVLAGLLR